MNQKLHQKNRKQILAVLVALCIMVSVPILATASANTVATLTVAPTSNSNVITVIGNMFNANETVYLALVNQTTGVVMYNFTEAITTSSIGTFAKDVTLPPASSGTYIIYAKTSTVTASTLYTIANSAMPKIVASPANSNIIKVVGSGFSPMEGVGFILVSATGPAFNFTDIAVTDNLGNFTITLIIPTSINGNYTLMAQTRTGTTANAAITVPDLTGPKGDTGETGDKGAKGAAGPAGKDAESTMLYAAIIISIIAAVISIASLVKDREPDDE